MILPDQTLKYRLKQHDLSLWDFITFLIIIAFQVIGVILGIIAIAINLYEVIKYFIHNADGTNIDVRKLELAYIYIISLIMIFIGFLKITNKIYINMVDQKKKYLLENGIVRNRINIIIRTHAVSVIDVLSFIIIIIIIFDIFL